MSADRPQRVAPVVAACHFVAAFAALGLPPFLTSILPGLGDTGADWAGVLYVVPTIGVALSAPVWGRLGDRYGQRTLLLRAQLGLALAFWLAGQATTLWGFAGALALQGLLGGTFAASSGYLAATLEGNALARGLTLMHASARMALVVAPVLVGVLSPLVGAQQLYSFLAVLPLAAALLAWRLPTVDRPRVAAGPANDLLATFPLRRLLVLDAAFVFATVITFPYLLDLVDLRLPGLFAGAAGALFALPHVCYLLGARRALRMIAARPERVLAWAFVLVAVGDLAHVVVGSVAGFVLARLVLGAGLTLGLVALNTLSAQAVRGRAPATMFGTLEMASKGGAVLAGLVASALAAAVTGAALPSAAAPMAAGAFAAALVALALLTRSPRPAPRTPAQTAAETPCPADEADLAVAHTLLNCLVRELAMPEHQVRLTGQQLTVRLPRHDVCLRAQVARESLLGAHRFAGPVQQWRDGDWVDIDWAELAECLGHELTLRAGTANPEFLAQVASSHAVVLAALQQRNDAPGDHAVDPYVAAEQSLVLGHRFHPTPKARQVDRAGGVPVRRAATAWQCYAPELGASFALRWLAVRPDHLRQESVQESVHGSVADDRDPANSHDFARVEPRAALPEVPDGFVLLPVHPWQYALLGSHPVLRGAIDRGDVVDLGVAGPRWAPTASVRTLYQPNLDAFLKFSLDVRITNCVRKNAAYELAGAVALTRLLAPVMAQLRRDFPACGLLAEPAFRALDLDDDRQVLEGFGVIVRQGLRQGSCPQFAPDVTPLLAAALTAPHAGPARVASLLGQGGVSNLASAQEWIARYVALLAPPVLHAFFHHGVVFEAHLQNVVVGVDDQGLPVQIVLRDLEGTKLIADRHRGALATLPALLRAPLCYDQDQGWLRVAYCLLVNHIAEVVGAVADVNPGSEPVLWEQVGAQLTAYADAYGCPPQLRAVLAGVPLPAKANLLLRWERRADRHAGYVWVPNPLAGPAGSIGAAVPARPADAARKGRAAVPAPASV